LPLIAFYVVAPFLFLIMHLYLLVNLYVLGRRIHLFEERLGREVPVRADQERVRARLDPFIVLLHVAGRMAAPVPRWLLALTVWITVVLAPVILLIFFQVQFLPYHSEGVTWVHRGLIVADLLLLWLSVAPIPSPEGACSRPPGSRGEGTAPAPVGARQAFSPARGTVPIVPGVSSATPPALRPERPMGAAKVWNGDLQTPCGSAGEARVLSAAPSRRSCDPSSRPGRFVRAADQAWANSQFGVGRSENS
jgi:hypothetical protein